MSVVVREARSTDAAAIVAIHGEAAAERRFIATQPEEVRTPEAEAARLDALREEGGVLLVAEASGIVVGICGVHRATRLATRHTAEVGLTVAASHRGRGVGRALMLAAEAWAVDRGIERLVLGVFTDNERAVRLYRALGYQEEGVRRGHYRLGGAQKDELLMAKRVLGPSD